MNKIDKETAGADFERMSGFFDIDTDPSDMNEEEAEAFDRLRGKVVRAIRRGALAIADDGQPTYTTKAGVAVTLKEPNGATLLAKAPGKNADDPMRRMFAVLNELSGGKVRPAELSIRDTGVLTAIVNLFLAELQ